MVGAPIRLGPFTGGLNLASDPTAIADAELTECHNFELDIDGSLLSRTPYQELNGYPTWAERVVILGEAIFSGLHYVIGSNSSGVYYYLNGSWVVITTTFQAAVAIQYADKVYLVPHPSTGGSGGKWDPIGGFTAVAAIPKGQAAVVHKERLFVVPGIKSTVNSSRLTFCNPGNFDSWTASDFADIGQGDGTKLIDVTVFQDNLLLFKNQNTYVLSYDVRPADAVVRKISLTIGVNGQFNMVNYENQVYVFHGTSVYEIINYDFNRLNTKVPFDMDQSLPAGFTFADESVFLSLLGDRLICRFYKKTYAFGLKTRTWSEWESTSDELQYFGPIATIRPTSGNEYYSGSVLSQSQAFIKFFDLQTSTDTEDSTETSDFVSDTFTRTVADDWGSATSGQAWTETGPAGTDFDVAGGKGTHLLTTTGVFRTCTIPATEADQDSTVTFETAALATGSTQIIDTVLRYTSANDAYYARVEFTTTATVVLSILKITGGVQTVLATLNPVPSLTHVANTQFKMRFQVIETRLAAKVWLASNPEPLAFTLVATDATQAGPGSIGLRTLRNAGNTNANLVVSFDNLTVITLSTVTNDIDCWVRTKNFDMAVSHQFKRLWWWGADVSTSRDIEGIASPITVEFKVYWGDLATLYWGDEEDNYWGQPLSEPVVIDTIVPTSSGVARQFVKFMKGLRYRQINFKVQLVTQGSNLDGPARLFTMTILTETRQVVPKAVN